MLKRVLMVAILGVLVSSLFACSSALLRTAATSSINIDPKEPLNLNKAIAVTESLRVNIVAPEARRVELYAAPVGESSLGVLLCDDYSPRDGWGCYVLMPYSRSAVLFTAVIHYEDKIEQCFAKAVWKGQSTPPVSGTLGLMVIRPGGSLTTVAAMAHVDLKQAVLQSLSFGGQPVF